jgi:hypothetical protein
LALISRRKTKGEAWEGLPVELKKKNFDFPYGNQAVAIRIKFLGIFFLKMTIQELEQARPNCFFFGIGGN